MGRVADIITRVRYTLRDASDRYSDTSLLRKISEGQKDIVKKAKLLRFKEQIAVLANVVEYTCTTNVLTITRASSYTGRKIPFATHEELDEKSINWEADTGNDIEAIVIDRQNKGIISVYPKQTVNYGNIFIFGSRTPADITDTTSLLDIDVIFDTALKYYVVAMCLHDNQDPVSRNKSAIFGKLYTARVALAVKALSQNSTRTVRKTTYNGDM